MALRYNTVGVSDAISMGTRGMSEHAVLKARCGRMILAVPDARAREGRGGDCWGLESALW